MTTKRIDPCLVVEPDDPDDASIGRCPSCDTRGVVGARCEVKACRAGGYHVVPRGAGSIDRRVGQLVGPWLVTGLVDKTGRYAAIRHGTHDPATLQLVPVEDEAEARRLLADIARARATTTRLGQPGVLVPAEVGTAPGLVWLVDDLPAGARSLQRVIDDRRRNGRAFSLVETLAVIEPICAVLARAHERGILHLELTPELVVCAPNEGALDVRVAGYGRGPDPGAAVRSRASLVSPFMAPEQLTGKGVGPPADLYAVAVMTFELITLRRPFTHGGRIHEDKSKPARDVLAQVGLEELGPALQAFFVRALDPDPRRRFSDAATMASRLELAMAGRAEVEDDDATSTMILGRPRRPRDHDDDAMATLVLGPRARVDEGAGDDDDDGTATLILGKPGLTDTILIDPRPRRRT